MSITDLQAALSDPFHVENLRILPDEVEDLDPDAWPGSDLIYAKIARGRYGTTKVTTADGDVSYYFHGAYIVRDTGVPNGYHGAWKTGGPGRVSSDSLEGVVRALLSRR